MKLCLLIVYEISNEDILLPHHHCPSCLYSKHVDIMPGDRANQCNGLMKPIGIEKYKDSYKIIYKCIKCNQLHKNIMATDDNYDLILTKEISRFSRTLDIE